MGKPHDAMRRMYLPPRFPVVSLFAKVSPNSARQNLNAREGVADHARGITPV